MKSYMNFALGENGVHVPEDLCLVLDTSPSMDFNDFKPSRLHGATQASAALIEVKRRQCPNDRIGVVAFSDRARVVHPMARVGENFDALLQSLEGLSTSSMTNIAGSPARLVGESGSNMGGADVDATTT